MFSYLLTLLYFLSEQRATQNMQKKKDSQKIILNGENMTQKRIALALKKNKNAAQRPSRVPGTPSLSSTLQLSWPSPKRLEGKKRQSQPHLAKNFLKLQQKVETLSTRLADQSNSGSSLESEKPISCNWSFENSQNSSRVRRYEKPSWVADHSATPNWWACCVGRGRI